MILNEEKLSSEHVFSGRLLNIYKDTVSLPNGKQSTREVVAHTGGVCVAALTENDELLFVKQYRYAVGHQMGSVLSDHLAAVRRGGPVGPSASA